MSRRCRQSGNVLGITSGSPSRCRWWSRGKPERRAAPLSQTANPLPHTGPAQNDDHADDADDDESDDDESDDDDDDHEDDYNGDGHEEHANPLPTHTGPAQIRDDHDQRAWTWSGHGTHDLAHLLGAISTKTQDPVQVKLDPLWRKRLKSKTFTDLFFPKINSGSNLKIQFNWNFFKFVGYFFQA